MMVPSMMRPKNRTGLECIDGINDEDVALERSLEDDTEKGVVFIDLPLIITMLLDLLALNSSPAQVRAVVHRLNNAFAPDTEADIMLMSSINARIKGKGVFLLRKWGALVCKAYSMMIFMPTKNKIMDKVQP